jgi:hypothetical protein
MLHGVETEDGWAISIRDDCLNIGKRRVWEWEPERHTPEQFTTAMEGSDGARLGAHDGRLASGIPICLCLFQGDD